MYKISPNTLYECKRTKKYVLVARNNLSVPVHVQVRSMNIRNKVRYGDIPWQLVDGDTSRSTRPRAGDVPHARRVRVPCVRVRSVRAHCARAPGAHVSRERDERRVRDALCEFSACAFAKRGISSSFGRASPKRHSTQINFDPNYDDMPDCSSIVRYAVRPERCATNADTGKARRQSLKGDVFLVSQP